MTDSPRQELAVLPLRMLVLGENIRTQIDPAGIDELADSMREVGILQPITVAPHPTDTKLFEVLVGQRRYLAARQAKMKQVPCIVRPQPDENERDLIQLAENFERRDMRPTEEGLVFARFRRRGQSVQWISGRTHRSAAYITQRLHLLDYPTHLQAAVDLGWVGINCALSSPPGMYDVAGAELRVLKRVMELGDGALRDWVNGRLGAEGRGRRPTPESTSTTKGVKQGFTIVIATTVISRAKVAAKAEGMRVADWVEAVLDAALADRPAA